MPERTLHNTSKATVAVVVVMSLSALLYATVRRGVLRSAGSRALSTIAAIPAAATAPSCCSASGCVCEAPQTIDPIVPEENEIERTLPPEIKALHAGAVAKGESTYIDPSTGFTVFTRLGQMRKLQCCGCRCRHCPYGHVNVGAKRSKSTKATATTAVVAAASSLSGVASKPAQPSPKPTASGQAPRHSVVYTKTGDKGTSALFTGERRKKTDPVFETLGALDELSSHCGLARAMLRSASEKREYDEEMMSLLEGIQQQLLNAGTVVATPVGQDGEDETAKRMLDILEKYHFPEKTADMEKVIDVVDSRLTPLRIFILPGGGNIASAQLHVCRTVCRRAERRMIEVRELYGESYTDHLRQATVYVNRLSDFLFVAARSAAEEDIVRKYD